LADPAFAHYLDAFALGASGLANGAACEFIMNTTAAASSARMCNHFHRDGMMRRARPMVISVTPLLPATL
jgi:hypothetical protein